MLMAELPVFVAGRSTHRNRCGNGESLIADARNVQSDKRIHWFLMMHRCSMGVPLLGCATWQNLVWIWALVAFTVCLQSFI